MDLHLNMSEIIQVLFNEHVVYNYKSSSDRYYAALTRNNICSVLKVLNHNSPVTAHLNFNYTNIIFRIIRAILQYIFSTSEVT